MEPVGTKSHWRDGAKPEGSGNWADELLHEGVNEHLCHSALKIKLIMRPGGVEAEVGERG